ncbi:MAG: phosphate ABC transporter, permease protein PstA, partial [Alicyclobacillus sp.]|nr:phosphate ABC transporter, permease protein PstA [Alicyclobacillus sp.]
SWQLVGHQVGYLTYVVWAYIDQPFPEAHALAYSAAFVLLVVVFMIHVLVRWAAHWVARRGIQPAKE